MTQLQVELKEKDSQLSSFKNDMEEKEGLLHRLQEEAMLSTYEQEMDSLNLEAEKTQYEQKMVDNYKTTGADEVEVQETSDKMENNTSMDFSVER